jgi:rsbT co-antagonist protein RsbR
MSAGERDRDDARRIETILGLLADVAHGTYRELDDDLPETDPFGLLYRGINEAVAALATARDRALAYQHELEVKLSVIERQREAIRELSTPVIEVWAGVLCLPIVGVVDTARSTEMTDVVLDAVVKGAARCVIIDITGIEVMDTRTTDQLIRLAKIIHLLDARCYVTGISPVIAQTIDQMGVDISSIAIRRNLRDALKEYVAGRQAARRSARLPPGGPPRSGG